MEIQDFRQIFRDDISISEIKQSYYKFTDGIHGLSDTDPIISSLKQQALHMSDALKDYLDSKYVGWD